MNCRSALQAAEQAQRGEKAHAALSGLDTRRPPCGGVVVYSVMTTPMLNQTPSKLSTGELVSRPL